MALTLPDPRQIESLSGRALRGKDLLFLRQWTGLSISDCCYLLGMPLVRWHYYQKRPDSLIEDAGVALLARALLTHPEAHYLPRFPTVAEVYPVYQRALQQSTHTLAEPDTAFGLLLGRDRASVRRWRRGDGQRQVPAPVRRLLLVLQTLLLQQGVSGFEALVDRATFEAAARGFDLHSSAMTTWTRRAPYRPRAPDALRLGRPPHPRPRPEPQGEVADAPNAPRSKRPAPQDKSAVASWLPPLSPLFVDPSAEAATDLPPLARRPMSGRDILTLQQQLGVSFVDLSYVLGHPLKSWQTDAPADDRPINDPALGLLVWALTHFPSFHSLPTFPAPAEVFPLYQALAGPREPALPIRPPAAGRAAFSLLLGREIKTVQRWLAETHPEPVPPTLRRLLFAGRWLLQTHGAAGLDAWIARATLEARARDLDLTSATAWPRVACAVSAPPEPDGGILTAPAGHDPIKMEAFLAAWRRDLDARPVCGRDLRVLCRWLDLPTADGAYLLGIGVPKYRDYQEQPERMIDDPAVALLVWALLTYPETHYLTPFPTPAAIYPLFVETAARSVRSQPMLQQYRSGATAFSVLLGRARNRMNRWLSETDPQPVQPPVARLLGVLRQILHHFGVAGFDAWIEQVRIEAAARGLDPDALHSWKASINQPTSARAQPEPGSSVESGLKRPRGRPRKRPPASAEPTD